jgi:Di-haem oxidoreductase, putative peroxidase
VLRAPNASAELKAAGSALFEHEWQPGDVLATGDGLGPVFNERSCVACHFQGGVGGGGDAEHNVTAFEADPVKGRPGVQSGVLHTFAVAKDCQESPASLREFFPIVPGGVKVVGGCTVQTRDFDPVRMHAVNATALFGAGWIDRISSKTILYESRRKVTRDHWQGDYGRTKRHQGWSPAYPLRRPSRQIRLEGPVRHP